MCDLSIFLKIYLCLTHIHPPNNLHAYMQVKDVKHQENHKKNKGLRNRDLTSPNSFLERVQKSNFEYKNDYFYTLNLILKIIQKNYSK